MKKLCIFFIVAVLLASNIYVQAEELQISSKSYILMDSSSGKILIENNADEKLPPASITKIMTMLLTMEAIDSGEIKESDIVVVSKNAAIKTGSHVYLSEGEHISVEELLKSVAVASGNDASIALAEYVSGSLDEFVKEMNIRAKELGMINTNFVNCNGLDADNHYSTARDIACMTNELLKHKGIFNYTTIWMDTIRNGSFGLSNTNKLIRFYEGANGMKTGSTSLAGCCLSATAQRNGMQLTAVVLGAPTSKDRFSDASDLLNFGFNNFESVQFCKKDDVYKYVNASGGKKKIFKTVYESDVNVIVKKSYGKETVAKFDIPDEIEAPIKKGDKIGCVEFYCKGNKIGGTNIIAGEEVEEITLKYTILLTLKSFLNIL